MENNKITLKDVAKETGYSLLSVHRAVHNKEGISDKTREKILKAVKEMGYEVNYGAAALKRKKLVFALVSIKEETEDDYYSQILKGARKAFKEKMGLNCELKEFLFERGSNSEENEISILNKLINDEKLKLDGIVITPICSSKQMVFTINKFIAKSISVILIDNDFSSLNNICSIAPNSKAIGQLAGEFISCMNLPKGKIIIATGNSNSNIHKDNAIGFKEYLKDNKNDYEFLEVEDGENKDYVLNTTLSLLRKYDDIVALYTVRERNTIALCDALIKEKKERKIKVIGSDLTIEHKKLLKNGILTGILHKDPYNRGYLAMKVITDLLIKNIKPQNRELSVPINIVFKSNLQFFETNLN